MRRGREGTRTVNFVCNQLLTCPRTYSSWSFLIWDFRAMLKFHLFQNFLTQKNVVYLKKKKATDKCHFAISMFVYKERGSLFSHAPPPSVPPRPLATRTWTRGRCCRHRAARVLVVNRRLTVIGTEPQFMSLFQTADTKTSPRQLVCAL